MKQISLCFCYLFNISVTGPINYSLYHCPQVGLNLKKGAVLNASVFILLHIDSDRTHITLTH